MIIHPDENQIRETSEAVTRAIGQLREAERRRSRAALAAFALMVSDHSPGAPAPARRPEHVQRVRGSRRNERCPKCGVKWKRHRGRCA